MATNLFHGEESISWRRIYFMATNLFHGDGRGNDSATNL